MKCHLSFLAALLVTSSAWKVAASNPSSTFGGGMRSSSLGYGVAATPSFGRRRSSSASLSSATGMRRESYMPFETDTELEDCRAVQQCSAVSSMGKNLMRGALLRIASDISGGTPLESIKCRVTTSTDNMFQAYNNIVNEAGYLGLWAGTPSRTCEGALLGALFILGSSITKKQVLAMGGSKTVAALAAGTVGGVAQSIVMTPAGMIFTSLNVNRGKKGYENDNAITVMRRIVAEKGVRGMYIGTGPMILRQASNWASRSCFTEIARTTLRMSQYGMIGEIGSGVIGGLGSCWNTPIETIRVLMQRDISMRVPKKTSGEYWSAIVEDQGYQGLFRGVTPRGIQAIWQTVFMVVVPNIMGI